MIKANRVFLLIALIIMVLVTLYACNNKEYNNDKGFNYEVRTNIDTIYDSETDTSSASVSFLITNTGSASVEKATFDCVFLDDNNVQIDRQSETFNINLPANEINNNPKIYFLVFENVVGNPTKVSVFAAYGDFGLTEQEQHDADIQSIKNWLLNNWWIWIIVAYVIIGIVVGLLCGSFSCADFAIDDEYMWISIACGLFWPVGGIILLIVFLQENILIPEYMQEIDEKESDDEKYQDFTVVELKEECKNRGLSNYSSLKKNDLIALLMNYDNSITCGESNKNMQTIKSVKNASMIKAIPTITLADIAGLDEAKEAFNDRVILPIKHRELFDKYGKNVGGGILLYGLPGTGKTMFAQAVANELEATFFSIKCSDIMSKWYGESETKIKQLFAKAKKVPVAVIFFDEFEAIGRKRTAPDGESGVSTVQEILAQMQGVEKNNNILLVLAATNCPWDIDSALLRPGRFNDKIFIPLPDFEARYFIIKKVLAKIQIADDVSLSDLAESLDGYNSADVVEFCEQVKMVVIKREIEKQNSVVTTQDIATIKLKVHSSILKSDMERMDDFRHSN